MGKASSTKKVARAAGTGGGRTARGNRPYVWYSILTAVVVLGSFLIVFSRNQQQQLASFHPRGSDHWHAAYAIDICGTFKDNLPQNPNLSTGVGIHTHGDGLIHVEPFASSASADAGKNATVARFALTYPSFKLTSTSLQYPGGPLYKNGQKCGNKPAQVRIRVWSVASGSASITYSNPNDVHLKDQSAITVAFLPPGDDIPKPSAASLAQLKNPNAAEAGQPATTPPISVPPGTPTSGPPSSPTSSAGPTTPGSPAGSIAPSPATIPPGTGPPPTPAK